MAVNNIIGGIMAKHVIGAKPAICFNNDSGRYDLVTYISEEVYRNIFEEADRCGFTIYRDNIDRFISNLLNQGNMAIQYASRIYKDNEILAGERIRLYSKNTELDLLKVSSRCYICINGALKGEIIFLNSDNLDITHKLMIFNVQCIAFLIPGDTFAVLDYKYLKTYRSEVVTDITELYNEVYTSFQKNALEVEFHNLLDMCSSFGISIWTLMGMIDFLQIRTQYNCRT